MLTPFAFRCATTSSGVFDVRKHKSSLPAASWSAVNQSTLSASLGRTFIFWLPNTSEVRGGLPPPGSNTLISIPRIRAYHWAERATSLTLITRWSIALTFTGMDHPFIPMHGGRARATLSPMRPACYNARPCQFKNDENGDTKDVFTPRRDRNGGNGPV